MLLDAHLLIINNLDLYRSETENDMSRHAVARWCNERAAIPLYLRLVSSNFVKLQFLIKLQISFNQHFCILMFMFAF